MLLLKQYAGKIDDVENLTDELIYLSAKYNLPDLLKACEVALVNEMTDSNALTTLVIVDRHCPTSSTRTNVIKYIATNISDNIDVDKEVWSNFCKQHPNLVTEIMRTMAANQDIEMETEGEVNL